MTTAPVTSAPADAPVTPASMDAPAPTPAPHPAAALEQVGFWRGPLAARTWREQGYLLLVMLTGLVGIVWFVLAIALIPALAVTVVGLAVGGALVVGARGWGAMHRALARAALRIDVAAPAPYQRPRGFWRTIRSMLGDVPGWRALLFMLLELTLGLTAAVASLGLLITSVGMMSHWYWSQWLPKEQAADGTWHGGTQLWPGVWVEGLGWNLAYVAVGVLLLFVWARLTQGLAHLFRLAVGALLGPTRTGARLVEVTRSRSAAVSDADARLRRIERDLHDGTQARLVAVAMQLGEARDQLERGAQNGTENDTALHLVTQAHASTKDAMTELRHIAQGIRPASLDAGLVLALETLGARSPVPVTLDVDSDPGARPEVEAIAYYCVAELLANVARHAAASHAEVHLGVRSDDDGERHLVVRVRDDGVGGARVLAPQDRDRRASAATGGTGLHGIVQRISAVDGVLEIDSPAGGPTVTTVTLPLTGGR